MNQDRLPMPEEITDYPQIAVLAVLDRTLVTATRALAAKHPEIYEGRLPRLVNKPVLYADRIVYLACELQSALIGYRLALTKDIDCSKKITS
jgi:small basic protein